LHGPGYMWDRWVRWLEVISKVNASWLYQYVTIDEDLV
jgi:hypothetical protein